MIVHKKTKEPLRFYNIIISEVLSRPGSHETAAVRPKHTLPASDPSRVSRLAGGLKRRHNTSQTAFPANCNLLARSAQRPSPRTPNQRTRPSTPGQSPIAARVAPRTGQSAPATVSSPFGGELMLRVGIPMFWLSAGSCECVIGETGCRRSMGGKMRQAGAFSGRLRLLGKMCWWSTYRDSRGVVFFRIS